MHGLLFAFALSAPPADYRYAYSGWASQVRRDTLAGGARGLGKYDREVTAQSSSRVPIFTSTVKNTSMLRTSLAGTDVSVQVRWYKLESIQQSAGTMRANVWVRMKWTDERLAWNSSAYGGITQVSYSPDAIWVPDITMYNARGGFGALDRVAATVSSEGSVTWSRPGTIEVLCRFSGLMMFPIGDQLGCAIEIGGWSLSGDYQSVLPYVLADSETGNEVDACSSLSESSTTEESALYSYTEYSIAGVRCERDVYAYDGWPDEPWPILIMQVQFERARAFYSFQYLFPTTLFTLVAFSVFFMGESCGERLGLGITVVLVIEVNRYTLASMIPVCGELLWIDLFLFLNFVFTISALLESCVVIAFAYNGKERLLPEYLDVSLRSFGGLAEKLYEKRQWKKQRKVHSSDKVDSSLRQDLMELKGFRVLPVGVSEKTAGGGRTRVAPETSTQSHVPPPAPLLSHLILDSSKLGSEALTQLVFGGVPLSLLETATETERSSQAVLGVAPSSKVTLDADQCRKAGIPPQAEKFAFVCLQSVAAYGEGAGAAQPALLCPDNASKELLSGLRALMSFGGFVYLDAENTILQFNAVEPSDEPHLHVEGPYPLSQWPQTKLAKAERFHPQRIIKVQGGSLQSFWCWVNPEEMRLGEQPCDHGAFVFTSSTPGGDIIAMRYLCEWCLHAGHSRRPCPNHAERGGGQHAWRRVVARDLLRNV